MKTRSIELSVGIFVVLFAAALFLLAMRVSGLSGNSMGDSYTLTAKFDNISGLKERAKVTIGGVKVGQVSKITFDPIANRAVVTLSMDKALTTFNPTQMKDVQQYALEDLKYSPDYTQSTPTQQKVMEKKLIDNMSHISTIDQDAYIKVATNGIIGEKYLKIEPGGAFTYIPQGGSFPESQTQGTVEIEDLVNKFITGASKDNPAAASMTSTAGVPTATSSSTTATSSATAHSDSAGDATPLFTE